MIDVDALVELREVRGWSYPRIADRLGAHRSSIYWWCLKLGLEAPEKIRAARSKRLVIGPAVCTRSDGRVIRRFTPEEDARILALEAEGLSCVEIARELGRERTSVVGRVLTLARREERGL